MESDFFSFPKRKSEKYNPHPQEATATPATRLQENIIRNPELPTNMEPEREAPPLNNLIPLTQTNFNRVFAIIYSFAILTLLYHHVETLLHSTTLFSFFITFTLLIADLVLAFMWVNTQAFRMRPVVRQEFPENLERVIKRSDFPAIDVFICTADPYNEPPIGVVNTALSIMAYDYPTEKISVYVSDDGGSAMTLFAFMEAAKFAKHWLPFCKDNKILDRNPEVYFTSNAVSSSNVEEIKMMYESIKIGIEHVLERGRVDEQYISGKQERQAFSKGTNNFSRQDHPSVIQVLLDTKRDRDKDGNVMPNLVYVSREKRKSVPHHFKAGALNVLLRVSATMTNAPIVLVVDCDMYSNDPQTPLRAICYHCDPAKPSNLGFVQFPQRYRGINKNDIYAGEFFHLFNVQPKGFDGLRGPIFNGTGCFFRRRAFFGGPSNPIAPEIPELSPDHVVNTPIRSPETSALAHRVASCIYEQQNVKWGYEIGFRYGSLVEDVFTGIKLKSEGWRSVFCNPERAAFLGDVPISLIDLLNQLKRWAVGCLEVGFCRCSPLTYGVKHLGILTGLGYSQVAFWGLWSIPIIIYAFLPQLALLHKVSIFPKVSEPWFLLYVFLFIGAYGQDFMVFTLAGSTAKRWWNDQRMWHVRALTSYLFGLIEFTLKRLGISASGFNVTSKLIDDEVRQKYERGVFEFGVHSHMFVLLTVVALINLIAFFQGLVYVVGGNSLEGLFVQMFIAGFVMVNCWPIYEAMVLRTDKGKLPIRTTITSVCQAWGLYAATSIIFRSYNT